MARDDLHFRLRIPDDLKAKVAEAAESNHRSMTAEIIARLESTFPKAPPDDEDDPFSVKAIEAEFARLLGRTLDTVRKAKSAAPAKGKTTKSNQGSE